MCSTPRAFGRATCASPPIAVSPRSGRRSWRLCRVRPTSRRCRRTTSSISSASSARSRGRSARMWSSGWGGSRRTTRSSPSRTCLCARRCSRFGRARRTPPSCCVSPSCRRRRCRSARRRAVAARSRCRMALSTPRQPPSLPPLAPVLLCALQVCPPSARRRTTVPTAASARRAASSLTPRRVALAGVSSTWAGSSRLQRVWSWRHTRGCGSCRRASVSTPRRSRPTASRRSDSRERASTRSSSSLSFLRWSQRRLQQGWW
mmetsp:Transcript_48500/g.134458  ORF Transcript_48500/g.134458 Transcript_48500/m.134458 type:complete len:261 (+) Transcript_48500:4768-5550(+)